MTETSLSPDHGGQYSTHETPHASRPPDGDALNQAQSLVLSPVFAHNVGVEFRLRRATRTSNQPCGDGTSAELPWPPPLIENDTGCCLALCDGVCRRSPISTTPTNSAVCLSVFARVDLPLYSVTSAGPGCCPCEPQNRSRIFVATLVVIPYHPRLRRQ